LGWIITVVRSIDLDNKPTRAAAKIDDELADRKLASERMAAKLPFLEPVPQLGLDWSCVAAQAAS